MPSRLLLCVLNAIDEATMSASPAMRATLPPSNLQLPARGRVARSVNAVSPQDIKFTWNGAGHYINFLMVGRSNLDPGSTIRVRLYATPDWTGSAIYDSGTVTAIDGPTLGSLDFGVDRLGGGEYDAWHGQQNTVLYFSRVLALSGIVTLENTGNAYGYLEASRLFAGDYLEVDYAPQTGDFGWQDDVDQSRSAGGSLRSDGDIAYRALEIEMRFVNPNQRGAIVDLFRYAGRRKELFVALFPTDGGERGRDYTMLAKIVGRLPKMRTSAGGVISMQPLSLEET